MREQRTWRTLSARRMSPFESLSKACRPEGCRLILIDENGLVRRRGGDTASSMEIKRSSDLLFCVNYDVESLLDLNDGQRREPEPGASRLDRGRDLVDIVANDAEPNALGVLLNHCRDKRRKKGCFSTR